MCIRYYLDTLRKVVITRPILDMYILPTYINFYTSYNMYEQKASAHLDFGPRDFAFIRKSNNINNIIHY